jgi:hypothetical protein
MITEKQTDSIDYQNEKVRKPRKKAPSRGGARVGGGRPKGSTNKISGKQLLEEAERVIGKPFITSLMEGYRDTILEGDRKHRVVYERLLVDKVASNLFDVEVTDSEDTIVAKQRAFAEAIAQIAGIRAPN